MKKLFQKMKLETKFRSAGEGHKLTDEPSSSRDTDVKQKDVVPVRQQPMTEIQVNAATAAMERHEKTKPTTSSRSKRYAKELAKTSDASSTVPQESKSCKKEVQDNATPQEYSVDGVKFISALSGDIYLKKELNPHYQEILLLKLGSEEGLNASCQMILTLNKDRAKVDIAVKTLCKYIDNITTNPAEEKFKRIKKENKVFSEKVATLTGTEEFLNSVGFKLTKLTINEKEELYFVLSNDCEIEKLLKAKDCLLSTEPLSSKVYRDAKVYKPTDHMIKFHLPSSFYHLTLDEVRRKQGLLSEEVELNQQLRTKAMREKPKQSRKYNFSLIRIRFPDGFILQGTFGVYEKFSEVRTFVSSNLNVDWAPYILKTSTGQTIEDDHESLSTLSLIPAVVLNLSWFPEVQAQLHEQGVSLSIKDEVLQKMQDLS